MGGRIKITVNNSKIKITQGSKLKITRNLSRLKITKGRR